MRPDVRDTDFDRVVHESIIGAAMEQSLALAMELTNQRPCNTLSTHQIALHVEPESHVPPIVTMRPLSEIAHRADASSALILSFQGPQGSKSDSRWLLSQFRPHKRTRIDLTTE